MDSKSFDDMFLAYAKEQEAQAARSNSNNSYSYSRDYEDIKWAPLTPNVPKIIRAQGGPPNSKLDNYTARTVTMAWVMGDDGKKFRLIRPSISEDPNYIINKIITKVSGVKWVNGVKTFPVKEAFPDIYNLVDKNGLDETDPRAKFEKGWKGKEVLMMNVIDRSQMEWHRENKHTVLLAKGSSTGANGTEYIDEGISAYAISAKLNHLFASYGNWEKYDMAITRTGSMNNPFNVVNASHSPMEVDASVRDIISTESDLTAEERSWEKYDLEKLYRVTTYTKLYNKLKNTIKRIDAALGTQFYEELVERQASEKKIWDELYADENKTTSTSAVEEVKETSTVESVAPTRRTPKAEVKTEAKKEAWRDLPHPEVLTDEQKAMVLEVIKDSSGRVTDIKWDCPVEELACCPEEGCGIAAPLSVEACPNCGVSFV